MPNPTKFSEPIINGALSVLQANLGAALAAITSEIADGVPLETPTIVAGYRDPSLRQSLPFLAVWVEHVTLQRDAMGASWATHTHEMRIQAWVLGDNEESLEKQLERYRRAIWDVLWQNQTLGGVCTQLILTASKRLWSAGSAKLRGIEWSCEATRTDTAG